MIEATLMMRPERCLIKARVKPLSKKESSFEIRIQHRVPVFLVHPQQQPIPSHSCIVHQDIDASRFRQDRLGSRANLGPTAHIHRARPGTPPQRANLPGHFFGILNGARHANHVRAFGREFKRDCAADAPAGAGDDGYLSGKLTHGDR
jgi:hypothetical protein